jgi:hypothetical protein
MEAVGGMGSRLNISTSMNRTLYKADKGRNKKIYFAEYSKEFQNVEGPGPGKYKFEEFGSSFSPTRAGKRGSFPKEHRRIDLPKFKDEVPLHYAAKEDYEKYLG